MKVDIPTIPPQRRQVDSRILELIAAVEKMPSMVQETMQAHAKEIDGHLDLYLKSLDGKLTSRVVALEKKQADDDRKLNLAVGKLRNEHHEHRAGEYGVNALFALIISAFVSWLFPK